jgi:hypothetical protein
VIGRVSRQLRDRMPSLSLAVNPVRTSGTAHPATITGYVSPLFPGRRLHVPAPQVQKKKNVPAPRIHPRRSGQLRCVGRCGHAHGDGRACRVCLSCSLLRRSSSPWVSPRRDACSVAPPACTDKTPAGLLFDLAAEALVRKKREQERGAASGCVSQRKTERWYDTVRSPKHGSNGA